MRIAMLGTQGIPAGHKILQRETSEDRRASLCKIWFEDSSRKLRPAIVPSHTPIPLGDIGLSGKG